MMADRNDDRPIGEDSTYEVHPGPDGTFTFSNDCREVTERCELSPEGQADRQVIEETYRRLTSQEPPRSE